MAQDKAEALNLTDSKLATPVFLKVKGLRGKYGKAMFGDDFVTTEPVEPELAAEIMERFKGHVKIVNK